MNKLYNTQKDFTTNLSKFIKRVIPNIRKTQINIIPSIIFGIIFSLSSVSSDIARTLKDDFSLVKFDSVTKRIRRLFNNKLFNPYDFYDKIITHVISSYKKKHKDKNVHITIDHMFSNDNYTVFMISMRIGTQGIPLWFRCFENKNDPDAFNEDLLIEGINYVSNLFSNDFNLIFLADRWFNSITLMKHIDNLNHTFYFRLRKNLKLFIYDKKEGHKIWKWPNQLQTYQYHSAFYNCELTEQLYNVNITISKRQGYDEPWIIVTNGDEKKALTNYSYRFGSIECIFKNQKSNGFNLERVVNCSLTAFKALYTLVCFATLFLTIIGADYSKNTKCYKNTKIETHKVYKKKGKVRVMSLFNVGLTLIKLAHNSRQYIRIPFKLILYDI